MMGDEFVQVGAGDADALVARMEQLVGEHAKLLASMEHAPTQKVLDLTHKIKKVQTEIKGHRAKGASASELAKHNHKLASLTIQQHDAASGGMNHGSTSASAASGTDMTPPDMKGLFSGWLTHWGNMRTQLTKLAAELAAHVAKTKTVIHKQHEEVDKHMEVVNNPFMS